MRYVPVGHSKILTFAAASAICMSLSVSLTSCKGHDSSPGNTVSPGTGGSQPAPKPSSTIDSGSETDKEQPPVVCDPFRQDLNAPPASRYGLIATLDYLPSNFPKNSCRVIADYERFGFPVNASIFFPNLDVSGLKFNSGFITTDGLSLKDNKNNTIIRNFMLHFKGQIRLTESDPEGAYQFAAISDGGTVFQISNSGNQESVNGDDADDDSVDNSSGTGTNKASVNDIIGKYVVASRPVRFDNRNIPQTIQLNYFHGTRTHLNLRLFWRYIDSDKKGVDWSFGKWKPVPAANFILPPTVTKNPCETNSPGPTTTIASVTPPEATTLSTSVSFSFNSNSAAATFVCSLDDGPASRCISPQGYSGLSEGAHKFKVVASVNGVSDPVGASYSWTIMHAVSTTILGATPSQTVTNSGSISIQFESNYVGANFSCVLDGAGAVPCVSPMKYDGLGSGAHSFQVYASYLGMADSVGASYSWTIDSTVPKVLTISAVASGNAFTVNATTDKPTTAVLQWGLGTTINQSLPGDPTLTTSFSMTVNGLTPLTIYNYTFTATDQAGNSVTVGPFRVRTSQ